MLYASIPAPIAQVACIFESIDRKIDSQLVWSLTRIQTIFSHMMLQLLLFDHRSHSISRQVRRYLNSGIFLSKICDRRSLPDRCYLSLNDSTADSISYNGADYARVSRRKSILIKGFLAFLVMCCGSSGGQSRCFVSTWSRVRIPPTALGLSRDFSYDGGV